MSSVYELSGNNLPELTSTSTPREYVHYFRQLITRQRNSYTEPEQVAIGYNRCIEDLVRELDILEYKIEEIAKNENAIEEANRIFRLCPQLAGAAE